MIVMVSITLFVVSEIGSTVPLWLKALVYWKRGVGVLRINPKKQYFIPITMQLKVNYLVS